MKQLFSVLAFVLTIAVFASGFPEDVAGSADGKYVYASNAATPMTIHAIYPGVKSKGDIVLVESSSKFLLMDTGKAASGEEIKRYLNEYVWKDKKKTRQKSLDLYISHIHSDHYGSFRTILRNFNIGTLYVYDGAHLRGTTLNNWKKTVKKMKTYKRRKNKKMKLRYLNYEGAATTANTSPVAINKFKVGKAEVKIMGAVVENGGKEFDGANIVNNMSLIARIEGGGMSYLTCGDIQENAKSAVKTGGEEILLSKKYKKKDLKSDIMKLSHHGLRSSRDTKVKQSNSDELLKIVKPKISFILQGTKNKPSKILKHRHREAANSDDVRYRTGERSRKIASKYGFCYPVSHEHKNFVVVCKSKKAKLYEREYSGGGYIDKRLLGIVNMKIEFWNKIEGDWIDDDKTETFYIYPSGKSAHDETKKVDGITYKFNKYGVGKKKS